VGGENLWAASVVFGASAAPAAAPGAAQLH
jgi:hypothetical protein